LRHWTGFLSIRTIVITFLLRTRFFFIRAIIFRFLLIRAIATTICVVLDTYETRFLWIRIVIIILVLWRDSAIIFWRIEFFFFFSLESKTIKSLWYEFEVRVHRRFSSKLT
jgi:hypothetical protein